jgi:hypothetical protein
MQAGGGDTVRCPGMLVVSEVPAPRAGPARSRSRWQSRMCCGSRRSSGGAAAARTSTRRPRTFRRRRGRPGARGRRRCGPGLDRPGSRHPHGWEWRLCGSRSSSLPIVGRSCRMVWACEGRPLCSATAPCAGAFRGHGDQPRRRGARRGREWQARHPFGAIGACARRTGRRRCARPGQVGADPGAGGRRGDRLGGARLERAGSGREVFGKTLLVTDVGG